jgi:hypothetical protein
MLIIGCDYHPSFQQIAFMEERSGVKNSTIPAMPTAPSKTVSIRKNPCVIVVAALGRLRMPSVCEHSGPENVGCGRS